MTGFLIYPTTTPRGNNAFDWWKSAAARYGIELQVYFYEHDGVSEELKTLPLPDFVILRGYNTELSRWYESQGIRTINPTEAMLLCRDKLSTAKVLAQAGLPTPKTWSIDEIYAKIQDKAGLTDIREENHSAEYIVNIHHEYAAICRTLGSSKFILKLNFGSKGENVFLVTSSDDYKQALDACKKEKHRRLYLFDNGSSPTCIAENGNSQHGREHTAKQRSLLLDFGQTREEVLHGCTILVQEYIESSYGRDIRVWVSGGEVIGHILRYNDNSFKSNFAAGGSFCQVELPQEAARLAIDATNAVGLHFAGIDLLYTANKNASDKNSVSPAADNISDYGFTVCEINGNAGFRTASTDIPDGIFRTLFTP